MNTELMTGFIMWLAGGGLLTALGVGAFFSKKEVGFFCNVKPLPMSDVKAYNRAVGKLWIVFGLLLFFLGLPLLQGQNSPAIVFSVLGIMAESIGAMAVHELVIAPRYRKK